MGQFGLNPLMSQRFSLNKIFSNAENIQTKTIIKILKKRLGG